MDPKRDNLIPTFSLEIKITEVPVILKIKEFLLRPFREII